jgi:beta-galactosidase
MPPWLHAQHPDALGSNAGGRYNYGGRKGYCPNHPQYLAAVDRVVEAMAVHFGGRPAVIGWQLDNEPGYPFDYCYDAHCLKAFQAWLQDSYKTLECLNTAWGTSFWAQRYAAWDQIDFPNRIIEGTWTNPGQRLDFRRFYSDSFHRYLARQAKTLRARTRGQFIFTNWPNPHWSVDVYRMAGGVLDATAWDNYNAPPGVTDYREQYVSGIHHDLCRGAGPGQHFFVAEQSAQMPPHALPEGVRLQTLIDLAHGSYGVVYFEWRPPLGGAEQGTPSVLGLDGAFGPAHRALARLGEELERVGTTLAGATTTSELALLYCYDNQWHKGFWQGESGYDHKAIRYYKGLKLLKQNIDVVSTAAEFQRYTMIVAPGLRIVSDALADKLRAYVHAGGVLVLDTGAGTRGVDNRLREALPPGVLADMAGVVSTGAFIAPAPGDALAPDARNQFTMSFPGSAAKKVRASAVESLELRGAKVLATFHGSRLTGKPAITVHAWGKGQVVYVGAESADVRFYEQLAQALAKRFHLRPLLKVPPEVEVVSRRKGDREFLFLLNLGEHTQRISLPVPMDELLSGKRVKGALILKALDCRILVRES